MPSWLVGEPRKRGLIVGLSLCALFTVAARLEAAPLVPTAAATPATLPTPLPEARSTASPLPASGGSVRAQPHPEDQSKPLGPLTETEVLHLAVISNRTLRIAQKQTQEAWYAFKSVSTLPGLNVTLAYQNGSSYNTNSAMARDLYVALTQALPPMGSLEWTSRAALENYEIARATEMQVRLSVTQAVRDGFYNLLVAQQQLVTAQETLTIADGLYALVRRKFENGAGPRLDLLNAEIQREAAEQGVILAHGALESGRAAMVELLGTPQARHLEARGPLTLPVLNHEVDHLVERARHNHPQIKIATRTLEQSKAQIKVAETQRNPSPQFSYLYDATTLTHAPVYYLGAQLSFPIDYGQIRNNVLQQRVTVSEKQAALEDAHLSVEGTVRAAWATWLAASTTAASYKQKVLEPSEQVLKITEYGYREGAVPYLQVLTAQQNLKQARSQYASLLQTGHQALDALETAVGAPLVEVKP